MFPCAGAATQLGMNHQEPCTVKPDVQTDVTAHPKRVWILSFTKTQPEPPPKEILLQ